LSLSSTSALDIGLAHKVGSTEVIEYRKKGIFVLGRFPRSLAMKLQQYSVLAADGYEKATQKNAGDKIDWVTLSKG
jgi:hypothetical protein